MVDPSPLNLTISHWNQSLRRALQMHLPGCSKCYYACKGMIMFFTTALERKWPSQIHFHDSSPNLALRLHWVLLSTIPIYPLPDRKPSNWLLRWMLRCVPWLISSSLAGPMTSRKSHACYVPTGNTVNHPLLKMNSCSVEKSSSFLCTNHARVLPNTVACLWLCFLAWYQQGY